jgi:hypothetical protein
MIITKEKDEDIQSCIESLQSEYPHERGGMLKVLTESQNPENRFMPHIKALSNDTEPFLLYVRPYHYAEVRWSASLSLANQSFLLGNEEPIFISNLVIPIEKYELRILAGEAGIEKSRIYFKEKNTDAMTDLELREYHQEEYKANHSPFLEWFSKLNELNLLPVCDLELDQDFPRSTRWMADLARIAYYENQYDPRYPQIKRVQARRN